MESYEHDILKKEDQEKSMEHFENMKEIISTRIAGELRFAREYYEAYREEMSFADMQEIINMAKEKI